MTQDTAFNILKTGTNVFLTGEPGSGKTYLVNQYVRYLRNHEIRVAITASTGIAATHINGVTIHSWSGIGIRRTLTKHDLDVISGTERLVKQIRGTQVLIIDEISMLDAGTLDMVEQVCRTIRQADEPFGGLQVVLVGDFFQLPPVSKPDEPAAQFAFTSTAWTDSLFTICYLTEQHRQSDAELSAVLAAIRGGSVEEETHALLGTRRVAHHDDQINATKLYSHNANVDEVNAGKLAQLPDEVHLFQMQHHGAKSKVEQLMRGCLSPAMLELKIGASVMCTRNNPEKGFTNGTLATIIDFDPQDHYPIIRTRTGRRITVEPMDWAIEEGEKVKALITQIPLRLAWAITVHKSQGMSLDAAVMDLSQSFAFGQGYVALSRVRTLDGLFLLGWNARALAVDPMIQDHDRTMRAQSLVAETAHQARDQVSDAETFIRHSGGNLNPTPSAIKPGEVVHVPPHAKRLVEIRKKYPQAYTPWAKEADIHLTEMYKAELPISKIAKQLERHPGGIRSRLKHLGLA